MSAEVTSAASIGVLDSGVATVACTLLAGYTLIARVMLASVATPSIVAELAFTVWQLRTGFTRSAALR